MTRTTRVNIRRSQQQYQIFRQAVTTSKGSFKSTPLRQNERPGRFCWTWAARRWLTESHGWTSRRFKTWWFSTARIAQGLKDDKEVEKTTLSETLNTASSTFQVLHGEADIPQGDLLSEGSSWCPLRAQASWWPWIQRQGPFLPTKCHIGCV